MNLVDVERLCEIAEIEFADIVLEAFSPGANEARILLTDGSFIDVWFSLKLQNRYSFHWERRALDGTLYRHDNAPHKRWEAAPTFPHHFHDGAEDSVTASYLSRSPEQALRQFLEFARNRLRPSSVDL